MRITALDADVAVPRASDELAPVTASQRVRRRRWWRIVRWALPIVAVIGVAVGVLAWYSRHTYYVGTDLGNVAIFRGRPGGVLIWNPTLSQRTTVLANDLPPRQRQEVRSGHGQFSSVSDARVYVRRLSAATTTTTTTVTTPSTATTTTTAKPAP
jgi:hypothetical protein